MKIIKPCDWNEESIKKLWGWYSANSYYNNLYFSNQLSKELLYLLDQFISLNESITALDFGCGNGHLLLKLLHSGVQSHGVDYSEASINYVNNTFKNDKNWKGAHLLKETRIPFPSDSFDLITCIEVIEHLSDDFLSGVLGEIHRVLKPGGLCLITTPFNEDTRLSNIYCPFCDTEFHKWQHVQIFQEENLSALLNKHHFVIEWLRPLDFSRLLYPSILPHIFDISPFIFYSWIRLKICLWIEKNLSKHGTLGKQLKKRLFLKRIQSLKPKNLCVIVKKISS